VNPFRYSGPVDASEVIDRAGELERLRRTADSANNTRLLAPREYGKTSLLRRLLRDAAADGWATVYVDFFGVLTLADVATRIEAAYGSQLEGELAVWFASVRRRFARVRVGGGPVPGSVDVEVAPHEQGLRERLDTPLRILERRGLRTLVVFDEWQDVLEAREDADEVIRSAIQHHGEAASYVFAGSEVGVMRRLFADRRRAFYRQAGRIDLAPLDDADLGEYIASRFRATGRALDADALGALLDRARGHPRCAMLLAHELWELAGAAGTADLEAYDTAEREALEKAATDLRSLWRGRTRAEREILTALARGEAPYSRRRASGGSRGGAVKHALERLADEGELVADGGSYSIVDPMFAELVRRDWRV
jgi:AAA+ ATPase superfamily predicted ATPase